MVHYMRKDSICAYEYGLGWLVSTVDGPLYPQFHAFNYKSISQL